MDRTVAYTGQVPLAEQNFLLPQRFGMTGVSKLAEATLGTGPMVDGLWVTPTTPPTLAVRVDVGQIYMQAALDPSSYGSLPADTAHQIVKQGVQMDPVTLAVTPPGTSGYAQWYLVQCNFQERDAGAVVLPYYNADNPAEALAGPNNSGNQQYTERRGAAVVQLKAGAPAPNGSHIRPQADPGWVGLAWVNAIQGATAILAQHVFPVPDTPRTRVKLPQIDRAVGFNYTIVRATTNLTPEQAGIIIIDSGALASNIEVRLPPAGSMPSIPLRLTVLSRNLTTPAPGARGQPVAKLTPYPGDAFDTPMSIYTNDTINLVSDGANKWHWAGTKHQLGVVAHAAGTVSIPHNIETLIPFTAASQLVNWWGPADPTKLWCPFDFARVRVTAGVVMDINSTGWRRARVLINGGNRAGLPWSGAPASNAGDFHGISLTGGEIYMFPGDNLSLGVVQTSGSPLNSLGGLAWMAIEVLQ